MTGSSENTMEKLSGELDVLNNMFKKRFNRMIFDEYRGARGKDRDFYENIIKVMCNFEEITEYARSDDTALRDMKRIFNVPKKTSNKAGENSLCDLVREGRVNFCDLDNLDYDTITDERLYDFIDSNGQNVLFATSNNPELTIRLIIDYSVEFIIDRNGCSAFSGVKRKTLIEYFKLGLHKCTKKLPNEYFSIYVYNSMKIEDLSCRFENKDVSLFLKHPGAIRYLTLEDFSDKIFFAKICNVSSLRCYDKKHAIEIAIHCEYGDLLDKIKTDRIDLSRCENWKNLNEDSVFCLLMKDSSNTEDILELALKNNYCKIISHIFDSGCPHFKEDKIPIETCNYLLKKYPDFRGVNGIYGLAYLFFYNGYNYPKSLSDEDLNDIDNLSKYAQFTEEQYLTLLSKEYRFSGEFYDICNFGLSDTDVLRRHPQLIKKIDNEKYSDKEFFEKLADIEEKVFRVDGKFDYPIFIAMQYNYKKYITEEEYNNLPYYLKYHNDNDVFIDLFPSITDLSIKEEVFKLLISKKYENLIKMFMGSKLVFLMDIRIKLKQREFDYLVENFPLIEIEDHHHLGASIGLYYYGVYHKLRRLPKYDINWCYTVNILILEMLDKDENFFIYMKTLFPEQDLYNSFFDFELFEKDEKLSSYYPLLMKFSPKIKKLYANMHEEPTPSF